MSSFIISIRLTVVTMAICVGGYTLLLLGFAQVVTPETADGSLVRNADGTVVGSRLIAQKFTTPGFFWPRPSAVDYNGAGAGGSNKSPTSSDLTERARELIVQYDASPTNPLPAELAAASGGGLDPHISESAARYQADRISRSRGVSRPEIEALIAGHAFSPGGILTPGRIVNVLELNLESDRRYRQVGSQ